jgi:rubrerythrin
MANRKYLFFAEVAKQLGNGELARLFRDTANQETEHDFAHFRLLYPELVIDDPAALSDEAKQQVLARCLELAIEGETYEYTTMYPDFAAQARADRDAEAADGFEEQIAESKEHAAILRWATSNFGFLAPIEQHHTERYGVALEAQQGMGKAGEAPTPRARAAGGLKGQHQPQQPLGGVGQQLGGALHRLGHPHRARHQRHQAAHSQPVERLGPGADGAADGQHRHAGGGGAGHTAQRLAMGALAV